MKSVNNLWRKFLWWSSQPMNLCRVCLSSKDVICFDSRSILHWFWRKTWCPQHCPEHDYQYQRDYRGHCCDWCGQPAPDDYY